MFFLEKFKNIVEFEKVVAANPRDIETLRDAKRMGFSDKFIGQLWGMSREGDVPAAARAQYFPGL